MGSQRSYWAKYNGTDSWLILVLYSKQASEGSCFPKIYYFAPCLHLFSATAKNICTTQRELAPVSIIITNTYIKGNVLFPFLHTHYTFSSRIFPVFLFFHKHPLKTCTHRSWHHARRHEAQLCIVYTAKPQNYSGGFIPLLPTIIFPFNPSKVGDITAGTCSKSSLIIPPDFSVLQKHLEDLPNYQPDNGEWSWVPGIFQTASAGHACVWPLGPTAPHGDLHSISTQLLPCPLTITTPSMWILWMKLSDSYEVGRGLFSKPGNVWTSGFIRDFSQSADSSLT